MTCVQATIETVRRNPERFQRVDAGVRRALVRRFPLGGLLPRSSRVRHDHRRLPHQQGSGGLASASSIVVWSRDAEDPSKFLRAPPTRSIPPRAGCAPRPRGSASARFRFSPGGRHLPPPLRSRRITRTRPPTTSAARAWMTSSRVPRPAQICGRLPSAAGPKACQYHRGSDAAGARTA